MTTLPKFQIYVNQKWGHLLKYTQYGFCSIGFVLNENEEKPWCYESNFIKDYLDKFPCLLGKMSVGILTMEGSIPFESFAIRIITECIKHNVINFNLNPGTEFQYTERDIFELQDELKKAESSVMFSIENGAISESVLKLLNILSKNEKVHISLNGTAIYPHVYYLKANEGDFFSLKAKYSLPQVYHYDKVPNRYEILIEFLTNANIVDVRIDLNMFEDGDIYKTILNSIGTTGVLDQVCLYASSHMGDDIANFIKSDRFKCTYFIYVILSDVKEDEQKQLNVFNAIATRDIELFKFRINDLFTRLLNQCLTPNDDGLFNDVFAFKPVCIDFFGQVTDDELEIFTKWNQNLKLMQLARKRVEDKIAIVNLLTHQVEDPQKDEKVKYTMFGRDIHRKIMENLYKSEQ
jgi:hypothetical protein